ncbi:MAG: antitoxin MazE-like protein [Tepidiformaceae bacterium]
MTIQRNSESSRDKVRAYRARKRAQGYRLMQRWVPDVESEEFKREARRVALAIANSPTAEEDQAFVDAVSWWNDEGAENE